ncbi:MAG: hypothetical protein R3C05_02025 [Pirellulaceae bacterium]
MSLSLTSVASAQDAEPATTEATEAAGVSDAPPTEGEEGAGEEASEAAAPTEEAISAYSTEEYIASPGYATFAVNNLWICISAALVFIMHLGFTTVEAGLTQKKNAVNIIFKNVWILSTGILMYAFWGFNSRGIQVTSTVISRWKLVQSIVNRSAEHDDGCLQSRYTWWGLHLPSDVRGDCGDDRFGGRCRTCETSGLHALLDIACWPCIPHYRKLEVGRWMVTGNGLLRLRWLQRGSRFRRFRGSCLCGYLGPRSGKYTESGIKPIPAHSVPLVAIGVGPCYGWDGSASMVVRHFPLTRKPSPTSL